MGKLAVIEAKGTERLKRGFAKMVKGGVIMDVTNRVFGKAVAQGYNLIPVLDGNG
ncbi:hypothetical protein [Thermococcus celericrescens]